MLSVLFFFFLPVLDFCAPESSATPHFVRRPRPRPTTHRLEPCAAPALSHLVTSSLHRSRCALKQLQGCRQDTIPLTANGALPLNLRLPGGASILCWHFKLPRHTLHTGLYHGSSALEHHNHLTVLHSRSPIHHPFSHDYDPKSSFL